MTWMYLKPNIQHAEHLHVNVKKQTDRGNKYGYLDNKYKAILLITKIHFICRFIDCRFYRNNILLTCFN